MQSVRRLLTFSFVFICSGTLKVLGVAKSMKKAATTQNKDRQKENKVQQDAT
jgi:hypothetical protein